ncbi:MAG: CoA ester lyase [Deltaproteobacteria bacterium]|nr:MAG: CoA ester lyase [Deltaproteobacteria bacterium]
MIIRGVSELEDAVILDLEDAVPIGEKETGRVFARDSVPMFKDAEIDVFVRVNSMGTGLTEEDISYVMVKGLDGIMLPKTEKKDDIIRLDQFLTEEEERKGLQSNCIDIIALVESPGGVQNIFDIVSASSRIVGVSFGAGDFLREMGVGFAITRLSFEEYYPLILYARSRISQAAKIAGIEAIDTPFFGLLIDTKGLTKESEKVKMLGFTGKQLIHPRHIGPVNKVFTPSEEDVGYAKSIVGSYEEAKAKGLGAASFGGRMIDYAMYKMGMDLILKAEAIAKKEAIRREKVF